MQRLLTILSLVVLWVGIAGTATPPFGPQPRLRGVQASPPASEAAPNMIFDEEFNGTKLNLSKWYRCYYYADEKQGCSFGPPLEKEWYQIANVTISGGYLQLTAKKQQVVPKYPYTSGVISTGGSPTSPPSFAFQYGYMEMRAKFPPGAGMWPAFWLIPADRSWPPEIDAMEWQGGTPKIDYATFHWTDSNGKHQSDGTAYNTGIDLSAGYHTYGLDWQANYITWYLDGVPIKTFVNAAVIPQKPMYIIVNLAVGGWISFPNKHTPFPAVMSVDYVRVWNQKPGAE